MGRHLGIPTSSGSQTRFERGVFILGWVRVLGLLGQIDLLNRLSG